MQCFFCLIKSADVPYFPLPPPLDSRACVQIWLRMGGGGVEAGWVGWGVRFIKNPHSVSLSVALLDIL